MNGFRLVGDCAHAVAIIVLLVTLLWKKSAKGISGKTQLLYALTYMLRYMDLWLLMSFISVYNTVMKIFFVFGSYTILYLIYMTNHSTQDKENDSFRIELLLLPVTILALYLNYDFTLVEICWSWSIYMEAVALVPQFYMIWKGGQVESSMLLYIFLMTLYRGMYIFNWVYRYYNEGYYDSFSIVAGIVETAVAGVGLLAVIALCIRRGGCGQFVPKEPTIYTLPQVEQQFQRDYKLLSSSRVDLVNKDDDREQLVNVSL